MRLLARSDERFLNEAFDDARRAETIEKLDRERVRALCCSVIVVVLLVVSLLVSPERDSGWLLFFVVATWYTTSELESRLRLLRVVDRLHAGAAREGR